MGSYRKEPQMLSTHIEALSPTPAPPTHGGKFYYHQHGEVVEDYITNVDRDEHGTYVEVFKSPGRFYWSYYGPRQPELQETYQEHR